jgi:hypothetical protein
MANPIRILAEDHFGGMLALVCAVICTALPALYIGAVLAVRMLRSRADPSRDRTDSNLALGVGVVVAIGFGFGLVPYWARALFGETVTGEVSSVEERRRSDTDVSIYTIRLADGRTLQESVENEDEGSMQTGRQVFVRVVRGVPGFERVGDEATLSQGTVIGSLIAWAVLVPLTIALGRKKARPS